MTTPEYTVLFRDDAMVAVVKPGGLLVHRTAQAPDRHVLLQSLARQVGRTLYPVHRLDRAASGVIVFGLSSRAARALHAAVTAEGARKEYLVLVRGTTPAAWTAVRSLTSPSGERRPCRTTFERLATFHRLSLLRARIFTGRRHQIRRHLHHAAHQVIGDTTYGKGRINRHLREHHGLPRLFLHAALLAFTHPESGDRLTITAPLPDDLRTFLRGLPGVDSALVAAL